MSDYDLKTCRGCKACCDKGEEFCPFKDDRNALLDKMMASNGVVFASPTYSFQVSAIMKTFLDRLGFAFHRPRFFGKTMMFRMGRTKIRMMLDETWRDYNYYREKGWFESDYFYPVRLSPLKQAAGRLFDYTASKSANR